MVKVERSFPAPESLAREKAKPNSRNYREPDVTQRLAQDFHGKCYLCEIAPVQDPEVEHLNAHGRTNRDKMFDWENLFWSCRHCNSVKNTLNYSEDILDCCKKEPEQFLNQELFQGHVHVTALEDEAKKTAELLTECFEKTNTGIREQACQVRVDALQETMTTLYRCLHQYKENPSPRNLCSLRGMLARSYKFAGFTRTYVREHLEEYPELAEYVML